MQAVITDDRVHAHGAAHQHVYYDGPTIDNALDERLPMGIRLILVTASILAAPFVILCCVLTGVAILSSHFFAKAMSIACVIGKLFLNQLL